MTGWLDEVRTSLIDLSTDLKVAALNCLCHQILEFPAKKRPRHFCTFQGMIPTAISQFISWALKLDFSLFTSWFQLMDLLSDGVYSPLALFYMQKFNWHATLRRLRETFANSSGRNENKSLHENQNYYILCHLVILAWTKSMK